MKRIGSLLVATLAVVVGGASSSGCGDLETFPDVGEARVALTAVDLADVIASLDAFVDVSVIDSADLTTQPLRALNQVSPDATAMAPAGQANWTPISAAVPGWSITATFADDAQAKFLMRIPHAWNGKLVSAGTPGQRTEYSSDIIISDYVLQKGYAYVTQNKGAGSLSTVVPFTDPLACPVLPVADYPTRSGTNTFVYRQQLDPGNTLQEWNARMIDATKLGRKILKTAMGSAPYRVYAMGLSNGGYQVLRAIESHPGLFDGAVDWSGVYWNTEGPNLISELPVGLKNFPAYRDSGYDPNSAAAQTMLNAGFPPDVVDGNNRLWTLYRKSYWETTSCLYLRAIDPKYMANTVDLDAPEPYSVIADYNYFTRLSQAGKKISHFDNTGKLKVPLIIVHGTLDALIPLKIHTRAYRQRVEENGDGARLRVYEVQNGGHVDALVASMPNVMVPLMPRAHEAFDMIEQWVEDNVTPPPSHCVPKGQGLSATTGESSCTQLAAP